jgi:hypothetical protein
LHTYDGGVHCAPWRASKLVEAARDVVRRAAATAKNFIVAVWEVYMYVLGS